MADLLQNCDLPPPQKIFVQQEKDEMTTLPSAPSSAPAKLKKEEDELGLMRAAVFFSPTTKTDTWAHESGLDRGYSTDLLRALQLSQTRAREAETKASALSQKSEKIAALLHDESLRLYAHQQLVKLLEIEIAWLEKEGRWWSGQEGDDDGGGNGAVCPQAAWCMALALCLGIAGVGLAVGYKYLF